MTAPPSCRDWWMGVASYWSLAGAWWPEGREGEVGRPLAALGTFPPPSVRPSLVPFHALTLYVWSLPFSLWTKKKETLFVERGGFPCYGGGVAFYVFMFVFSPKGPCLVGRAQHTARCSYSQHGHGHTQKELPSGQLGPFGATPNSPKTGQSSLWLGRLRTLRCRRLAVVLVSSVFFFCAVECCAALKWPSSVRFITAVTIRYVIEACLFITPMTASGVRLKESFFP